MKKVGWALALGGFPLYVLSFPDPVWTWWSGVVQGMGMMLVASKVDESRRERERTDA